MEFFAGAVVLRLASKASAFPRREKFCESSRRNPAEQLYIRAFFGYFLSTWTPVPFMVKSDINCSIHLQVNT